MFSPSNSGMKNAGGGPRTAPNGRFVRSGGLRQGGFTLLELMVALGISALLLALLYRTFTSTIQSTEHVDADTEMYRMAQIGLSIIGEELQSVYWSPDRANTFFSGTEDSLRFTSLSRQRYGEGIRGPELAALHYYLETPPPEPDEDPQIMLMHEEEPNLLSLSSESTEKSELAENVKSFKLRYRTSRDWVDSWDTSETKKLPKGVEVQLTLKGKQDREYEFFTRIAIPVAARQ